MIDDYEIISGDHKGIFWVALHKGNEVYIYSFTSGQEGQIMAMMIKHFRDEELSFNCVDASKLGTKVAQIAIENL